VPNQEPAVSKLRRWNLSNRVARRRPSFPAASRRWPTLVSQNYQRRNVETGSVEFECDGHQSAAELFLFRVDDSLLAVAPKELKQKVQIINNADGQGMLGEKVNFPKFNLNIK